MKTKAKNTNFFKSSEEVVSMFLGLLIVVLVITLVVNFFQRNRGKIDLPGISDKTKLELIGEKKEEIKNLKVEEKTNVYTVKIGDNLWKICQEKLGDGNRWTEVAKLNNLKSSRIIVAGQELKLPEAQTITTGQKNATVSGSDYIVKKGDSLWKISVQMYGDGYQWPKIYRANQKMINNPDKIEIGMKLSL